ncbi:MAG: fibronectin type III-like domain-contianing protein, partial [Clostridia bacterium]|nr:fibronectin type III-like domain-contianing protein [Clostridia bacterium]
ETDYTVSYDIKNLSNFDAKEVSQVYVKDVFSSVLRPVRELKGFSKDVIKAGQIKHVSVNLDFRSFAYYSTALDKWTIEKGVFIIEVGSSSRDIRLSAEIKI